MGDRLDEVSARRIARGRLNAVLERINDIMDTHDASDKHVKNKPRPMMEYFMQRLRDTWGDLLIGQLVQKNFRRANAIVVHPENDGSVDILIIQISLRSTTDVRELLTITGHAIARLMERRRDVRIEQLLAEEFASARQLVFGLTEVAHGFKLGETQVSLETRNGHFIVKQDQDGYPLAVTWINDKP